MDYIVKARHYSKDGTAKGYILEQQKKLFKNRGISVTIKNIDKPLGAPVKARVWQGQWIADCECNGACFVDPEDPVFFCFNCGNFQNGHRVRPVEFPEAWQEIERLLLDRPVEATTGLTVLERVALARPLIAVKGKGMLGRDWNPGEAKEDLIEQNKPIKDWKRKAK